MSKLLTGGFKWRSFSFIHLAKLIGSCNIRHYYEVTNQNAANIPYDSLSSSRGCLIFCLRMLSHGFFHLNGFLQFNLNIAHLTKSSSIASHRFRRLHSSMGASDPSQLKPSEEPQRVPQLVRPQQPGPDDCCGDGCNFCVHDLFEQELKSYTEAIEAMKRNQEFLEDKKVPTSARNDELS